MVSNAKSYNSKGTSAFSNAERIRKIVVSSMPKLNPAYEDPNYVPFSTLVPDDDSAPEPAQVAKKPDHELPQIQDTNVQYASDLNSGISNAIDIDSNINFNGETFEGAQEKIILEMIRLKDAEYVSSLSSFFLSALKREGKKQSAYSPC